jgi:2-keto-4-pentenoate hydratase/2-oxohepta-3-ene-1,7-dioic acid hydratase in catechol pathway
MKIICIGRNYADHAKELNNPLPKAPVFFLKPDTAVLRDGAPFFIPEFSNDIHHEIELVLRISKAGKHIEEAFADRYFDQIGLGIDFTARDLQQQCKEKGLPWEIAKGFDGSAPLGKFVDKASLGNLNNLNFQLKVNGEVRQHGNSCDQIFNFNKVIAYVSQFITLKSGDLIFTGTPAGVAAVKPGDLLQGYLGSDCLLEMQVK